MTRAASTDRVAKTNDSYTDRQRARERFQRLVALPPSAKLAYLVLEEESPLTSKQVSAQTLLPIRTTNQALRDLEDDDLVTVSVNPRNARQWLYAPQPIDRTATDSH